MLSHLHIPGTPDTSWAWRVEGTQGGLRVTIPSSKLEHASSKYNVHKWETCQGLAGYGEIQYSFLLFKLVNKWGHSKCYDMSREAYTRQVEVPRRPRCTTTTVSYLSGLNLRLKR